MSNIYLEINDWHSKEEHKFVENFTLADIELQNGILSGKLHVNEPGSSDTPLKIVLINKALKFEESFNITYTNNSHIQFYIPLNSIHYPVPENSICNFYIHLLFNNKKQRVMIHSPKMLDKINYSFAPFPLTDEKKWAYLTVSNGNLSLICGNSSKIFKSRKKDKMILMNLTFHSHENVLSFNIPNQNLSGAKIIMIERSSKIEWVEEIKSEDTADKQIIIDLKPFAHQYYNQNSRWDFYISTVNPLGQTERSRLGIFNHETLPKDDRYFTPASTNGVNVVTPYITELNGLSLVILDPIHIENEKLNANLRIARFNMKKNIIDGTIYVELPDARFFCVKSLILKYRSKTDDIEYTFPVTEKIIERTIHIVKFRIDISELKLQNYYWDFYLNAEFENSNCKIRLKNPSFIVRNSLNKKSVKQSYLYKNNYWVQPYVTAANTIALLYKAKEKHETPWFFFKEKFAYYVYVLFKWYFDRKDIWLGFEKFSDSAQDNGFSFFQYCYNQNKHKNFFYIIKKDSPDYCNVQPMEDKVLHYMSFKYMVYMYAAKLLISSESKSHAYDIRVQKGLLKKVLNHKSHIFLQHGVIALKRVDHVFKKTSKNGVDLFVASSEFEKDIIKNNFGYKEEEIIITGLSRWDSLSDRANGSEILLMPTWRVWMDDLPEEKFIESEYYLQYVSLLNSQYLINLLEQYNLELSFFIHPKFKAYIEKFNSNNKRIRIYQYGEEKVNQLLMRSSLLITDYSSVSWDMFYQKKPVLFYQFDLDDYLKYQGSYIDMNTELFGDRARTIDSLLELIKRYAERNFQEEEKYGLLREKYLKFTDQNNSSRTFQEIMNHSKQLMKRKPSYLLMESELIKSLWAFSKNHKLLFKTAKKLKKVLIDHKQFY